MGGIIVLILSFLLGSWLHLRSRTKKGLPPLRYHRVSFVCIVIRHRLHTYTNGSRIVLGQNSATATCRSTGKRMGTADKQSNGWLLHGHGSPTGIRSSQIPHVLGPYRCRKGRLRARAYQTTGRSKPCARLLWHTLGTASCRCDEIDVVAKSKNTWFHGREHPAVSLLKMACYSRDFRNGKWFIFTWDHAQSIGCRQYTGWQLQCRSWCLAPRKSKLAVTEQ